MKKLMMLMLVVGLAFMVGGATCKQNLQDTVGTVVCGDDAAKIAEYAQKFNELSAFDAFLAGMPYAEWIPVVRAGIASALAIYAKLKEGMCVPVEQVTDANNVLAETKSLVIKKGFKPKKVK